MQEILQLEECLPHLAIGDVSMPVDGADNLYSIEIKGATLAWPTLDAADNSSKGRKNGGDTINGGVDGKYKGMNIII